MSWMPVYLIHFISFSSHEISLNLNDSYNEFVLTHTTIISSGTNEDVITMRIVEIENLSSNQMYLFGNQ